MISAELKIRKSFSTFSADIEVKLLSDGTSLTCVRDAINAELGKGKTSVDQDKGITLGATRGRKTGGARTKVGIQLDVDNEDFTLPLKFKEWNDMRIKEQKSYPGSHIAEWPTVFQTWLGKMTHQPKSPKAPEAPEAETPAEYTNAQCIALCERDMRTAVEEIHA